MDKQNKNGGSDWEFNIDLDSIREQTAKEEAASRAAADQLLGQLDRMSAGTEPPEDIRDIPAGEDGGDDEDMKIAPAPEQPRPKATAKPDTTEQTVVIPSQPIRQPAAKPSNSPSKQLSKQPARQPSAPRRAPSAGRTQVFSEPAAGSRHPSPRTVPASSASGVSGKNSGANKKASAQPPKKPLTPRQQKKAAKEERRRQKRLARVERSRQRPKFRFAPVLASLLAITNVLTLGAYGLNYMQTEITVKNAEDTVKAAQKTVEEVNAQMKQLKEETIPLDQFQYNVAEYNIMAEFIQEFFDDRIVYKDTAVHYAEIDESLPMNDYNWDDLSWENGRPTYQPEDARHSSLGIDVSYHQEYIDWEAVADDGIDFAIIRCGYRGYGTGELVTDSNFPGYMNGALNNGLDVGVYFFSQAIDAAEAIEEAEYVLSLIADYDVTMPVVLDMEVLTEDARANDLTSAQRAEIADAFCSTIEAAGYTPAIYGNTAYYMSKIDFASVVGKYGIWLAQYYKEPFFPYQFNMWQYTDSGSVNGIEGKVDLNLYFGE